MDFLDTTRFSARAWAQARPALSPSLQAALAAAVAWIIADRVLRHPQPFFAPVAAAITMSTTPVQRGQRVVELVTGVLLGIGIAEGLGAVLGTSTAVLGVIVFAAFVGAKLVGRAFTGDGMLLANQTAVSAILVVTIHHHGTGADRAIDALVGGGVAAVFSLLSFSSNPVALLAAPQTRAIRSLADTIREAVDLVLHAGRGPDRSSASAPAGRSTAALQVHLNTDRSHCPPADARGPRSQKTARINPTPSNGGHP
jgi:hypothetical protein